MPIADCEKWFSRLVDYDLFIAFVPTFSIWTDSRPAIASRDSKYCLGQPGEHNEEPSQQRLTGCPANATCCLSEYSHSFVGCCMLKDAMDCGDSWHCCPMGTVCDPTCSIKGCSCRNAPWESIASRTVFSALMKSVNIFWNKITKKYEH